MDLITPFEAEINSTKWTLMKIVTRFRHIPEFVGLAATPDLFILFIARWSRGSQL